MYAFCLDSSSLNVNSTKNKSIDDVDFIYLNDKQMEKFLQKINDYKLYQLAASSSTGSSNWAFV